MIVRCLKCKMPYEERENLLRPGHTNWYPTCKHPVSDSPSSAEVLPEPEPS